VLSAGERQRLAIARILVQKPDVAVLDDALGALEDETRRDLLARLGRALPRLTVLSLARKSERDDFHTRRLSLERAEGGARLERVS
jgi:putative ATP-binding cassette transporter